MSYTVGQTTGPLPGNITQLNALILADNRQTERNLGFHPGRLSKGYSILVLKALPLQDAFEFDGTTLRSGGRVGLPGATEAADRLRPRVHDQILNERGAGGYKALQSHVLRQIAVSGRMRLVKVLPDMRHNAALEPDVQYPAGGGFLQWKLKKPGLPFFVAAQFAADGTVSTPTETLHLNTGNFSVDYPQRAKFQQYLQTA